MSPLVVLVGPPGSGKSTVGRLLAQRLNVSFRDTDDDIAEYAGQSIPDIFVEHGEEHFRALERRAVADAVNGHDGVLALGGGAVVSDETRALLADQVVAFLSVEMAEAVSRVGIGAGRPLLSMNPRQAMRVLLEQRRPLYNEVADFVVDTERLTAEQVAAELARRLGGPSVVPVGGEAPYDVVIGDDATMAVTDHLGGAHRAAILYSAPLYEHAARIAAYMTGQVEPLLMEVPDAEDGKTVEVAAQCWDGLAEAGFTRSDVVIGVGGGAVTDLAGFVAAGWLRGVAVIQLPTSLLGMVDAAVGGKTGVNIAAGKNLVGAFHPPRAVLCDLSTLGTLPQADRIAGFAEIIKCGFIADPGILDLVEADPAAAVEPGSAVLAELVERAVAVKASVVSGDLRESGRRVVLNYGHTLGHAIEKIERYRRRHGEAVAIGMVYAAVLSRITGRADLVERTRSILARVGLPVSYPSGRLDDLLAAMRLDKKNTGQTQRFVLLDGIGKPTLVDDVTGEQLATAYEEICA